MENQAAFKLLRSQGLHGAALALVRQELDSMARVIYLLDLQDRVERARLIELSIRGRHWTRLGSKGKLVRVTDRTMVELARKRHGWIHQVYQYGCNLIHLSDWHDYRDSDPTLNLEPSERMAIGRQLDGFHGRQLGDVSFELLLMHAPFAIEKIGNNLECYVQSLETL